MGTIKYIKWVYFYAYHPDRFIQLTLNGFRGVIGGSIAYYINLLLIGSWIPDVLRPFLTFSSWGQAVLLIFLHFCLLDLVAEVKTTRALKRTTPPTVKVWI